jgi:hypothetical protein
VISYKPEHTQTKPRHTRLSLFEPSHYCIERDVVALSNNGHAQRRDRWGYCRRTKIACLHSHTRTEEALTAPVAWLLGCTASGRSNRMRASQRQISQAMSDLLLTGGAAMRALAFSPKSESSRGQLAPASCSVAELTQGTNPCPHALASSSPAVAGLVAIRVVLSSSLAQHPSS